MGYSFNDIFQHQSLTSLLESSRNQWPRAGYPAKSSLPCSTGNMAVVPTPLEAAGGLGSWALPWLFGGAIPLDRGVCGLLFSSTKIDFLVGNRPQS